MHPATEQDLIKDYRDWSGGFDPEPDQIDVYLDCALPAGYDRAEARAILLTYVGT